MDDEFPKRLEEEFWKRRKEIRQRLEYSSDAELEAAKAHGDLEEDVATEILNDRRRQLARAGRTIANAAVWTACATVCMAVAAFVTIYLQYCQKRSVLNESPHATASIAPTPMPTLSPQSQ
jgi:hypothetical protein